MKHLLVACILLSLGSAVAFATPADDVEAAARKLSDAPNYCWITRAAGTGSFAVDVGGTRGPFNSGAAGGVADNTTGFSVITRQGPSGAVEIVRHGERIAVKNPQGIWLFPDELSSTPVAASVAANPPRANRRATRQRPVGGQRAATLPRGGQAFAGGAALPTEEIVALITETTDLKVGDGIISGALTTAAAASHLGALGSNSAQTAPLDGAIGTVTFSLKAGMIESYEIHLKASIQGRVGRTTIDRTITTEIMDVGTTKVVVPDDAKVKLAS